MTTKIPASMIEAGVIPEIPSPKVLQVVRAVRDTVGTGTTTVPIDDTIPQSTEGTEFLAATITPTSASSNLLIEVDMPICASAAVNMVGFLLRDSGVNAIAATTRYCPANAQVNMMTLSVVVPANSTDATTFKLRAGPATAATVTVNGFGGSRYLGGVWFTSMKITELSA